MNKRKIKEQLKECFEFCRELDDCYGLKIDDTHSLFLMVQLNKNCKLEYLIELNKTVNGYDEPCADFNITTPIDNFNTLFNTVYDYLRIHNLVKENDYELERC